ncbi:unnamed protein product [Urochloa decumbens]|uniref:Uncharacterized protein n=1 Tax=Urochloa decumbens TaxID=240449 RepID=A0ABC8XBT3_9POAL
MDRRRPPGGVPATRVASRLHLSTTFAAEPAPSSRRGARRGPPPALTVDVRIVIRRHFPVVVGPGGGARIAEKVAADIALRRRPARRLRDTESVERALADEVLPLVAHPFDRGAVVATRKEICAHVAAACDDPRVAGGGARVLVLIDTFACPVVLRARPPCKPAPQGVVCAPGNFVAGAATQRVDLETMAPMNKANPYGVIGDRRPKPVVERSKLEGSGTVVGSWTDSFSIFR